ncbi:hypothetical protein E2C01_054986 [Portunus trituberculatus]|uniref:Uncharacterized protein n=1 Tax=Portunus trituberculatus TaxID=210409 RepID=A0A5B7GTM7_PORTR|nr:hypothetical protein [Portunus trituberculatus]
MGIIDSPHCPWCPTQPDTPEYLLLHCPCHYSHCVALIHSLSAIHPNRPTLTDLLGGCTNKYHSGFQDPQPHQDLPAEIKSTPLYKA